MLDQGVFRLGRAETHQQNAAENQKGSERHPMIERTASQHGHDDLNGQKGAAGAYRDRDVAVQGFEHVDISYNFV